MNMLKKAVEDYVSMRRSLGYKLKDAARLLADFCRVLRSTRREAHHDPFGGCNGRGRASASPAEWGPPVDLRSWFLPRYWSATDPQNAKSPLGACFPNRPSRARPYLYTDKEIRQLLEAAQRIGGLRGLMYYCLLGPPVCDRPCAWGRC